MVDDSGLQNRQGNLTLVRIQLLALKKDVALICNLAYKDDRAKSSRDGPYLHGFVFLVSNLKRKQKVRILLGKLTEGARIGFLIGLENRGDG